MNHHYKIIFCFFLGTNLFCTHPFETFQINGNRVFLLNSENLSRYQFIQLIEYFKEQNIKIDQVMIDENKDFVEKYNREEKKKFSKFKIFKLPNYKYTEFVSLKAYDFHDYPLETQSINKSADKEGNTELHLLFKDPNIKEEELKNKVVTLISQGADIQKKNKRGQTPIDLMIKTEREQKVLWYLMQKSNVIESKFNELRYIHLNFLYKTKIESLLDFNLFVAYHTYNSPIPLITFLDDERDIPFKKLFYIIKTELSNFQIRSKHINDQNVKNNISKYIDEINKILDLFFEQNNYFFNSDYGLMKKSCGHFVRIIHIWFCNTKWTMDNGDDYLLTAAFSDYIEGSGCKLYNMESKWEKEYYKFLNFLYKYQNLLISVKDELERQIFIDTGILISNICKMICTIKTLLYLQENNNKNVLLILNKENYEFVRKNFTESSP